MARKEKVSKVIDGDTFETAGASTATWTMRNQTSGSETPPCRFVDRYCQVSVRRASRYSGS